MLSANSKKTRSKGRLVRSLEFETTSKPSQANATSSSSAFTKSRKKKSPVKSIWRKNVIDPVGFTTHKMSSVTNNFLSSDVNVASSLSSSESEIDEMVVDLVDPGRETLVFPQHDEVFRTSPLSSSSFIAEEQEEEESIFVTEAYDSIKNQQNFTAISTTDDSESLGMTWNPKQNQWLPLIYRYAFPSSAFSLPKQSQTQHHRHQKEQKTQIWSLKNGQVQIESNSTTFSFPPPQKSIMMGPHCDSKDARDVCEKLLELIDDENLMLPVVKVSPHCSSPIATATSTNLNSTGTTVNSSAIPTSNPQHQQQTQQIPLKSLLSEWSSLPSSPPPPIFHDVLCNRPIPELRLSPPMSSKSIGKRPNPTAASTVTSTNSPCESPLTKRLRLFSSSSSSIASQ